MVAADSLLCASQYRIPRIAIAWNLAPTTMKVVCYLRNKRSTGAHLALDLHA